MKNISIFLISLAFVACGKKEIPAESTSENSENSNEITITKQQFDNEKMEIGSIAEHPFLSVVNANGMIDVPPENRASVSTFVSGYVTKIPLLIGDFVKKGQFVAQLTNTEIVDIQQNYLEVASQNRFLKNEFERQKTLFNEQISSEKNYLRAESSYKSNLAIYNGLRKKLEMLHINPTEVEKGNISANINLYAPIDGYITKVMTSTGAYVSSASEILEIVNTNHIHLELNVFEKDILNVKKEQKIKFKVPESSNTYFDASVYLVGTTITENKTVKVHGHIDDEKQQFMAGMFVEASIIFESSIEFGLPISAIHTEENQTFIYVVKSQKNEETVFEKVIVTLGKKDENYVQIINFTDFKGKNILLKGGFML
ncbi:efflux RND transporter periplasmic adaptor subunit [Polaribacter gangjinensis]|uniref:Efflux transporter periplasmic adaptor subunit n=1 Tax=Polaribacter gangjinensis TaxID=574710 RepID=A0A2S7WCG2_9FLAO|nr:efflux RND transporter periplasmic adaptor subunit [Polaribacter gangjinensis]PQJ75319.1 efflux transporter periplasmic adaptor subunit [Polaribacter gangjinensis]